MARVSPERIQVEVVYAEADRQTLIALELDKGSTVADAIVRSGIATRAGDISRRKVGIFSRIVTSGTPLDDGDRVEIYRALLIDPKEARRKHGRQGK
jgi:uncharacterized protein